MIVGYARVSTDGQALDAQQTALQSRRGRLVDQSAKPPSAKARKPVSALPPQMGIVLIWPVFSSVTRALLSHSLVVGKHPQNALVSLLVHASRFDRRDTTRSPLESNAQFLDTTRRAVPPVAHSGLIGDASAFAATEKPDAVIGIPSIEDARRAVAFAAQEHEVSTAKMRFPPIAANDLPHGLQRIAAIGPVRKFQHQLPCIRSTGHFKPNGSE